MIALKRLLNEACALLVLSAFAIPAVAHEYWLQPTDMPWLVGEQLRADVRNGENFVGDTLPFDPDAFARAGLISENHRLALNGRLGDYPAFQMPLQETGLHLLLLETTRRELLHEQYSDFETFLNYHGLQGIAERHRNRDLPDQGIVEHYYRYCKSFIDVRSPTPGKDQSAQSTQSTQSAQSTPDTPPAAALAPQMQRLELIALTDPMQGNTLQLQLHLEGAPLANRQVELFHRDSESAAVTRTLLDTDANGLASFDTAAPGQYLFNSVTVLEPADTSAHWETLWASLTFHKSAPSLQ